MDGPSDSAREGGGQTHAEEGRNAKLYFTAELASGLALLSCGPAHVIIIHKYVSNMVMSTDSCQCQAMNGFPCGI